MKKSLITLAAALLLALPAAASAQQGAAIRLWPGKAPGSEGWTQPEIAAPDGTRYSNVVDPTLTPYLPDPAKATGTAVVFAPGGALRNLSVRPDLMKWFNDRGVAVFVLKYRTLQEAPRPTPPPRPAGAPAQGAPAGFPARNQAETPIVNGNANPAPNDAPLREVLQMGVADAQQALKLVRANAARWRVDPKKVGILGISAGGGVGVGAALAPPGNAYPDFLISAYGPALQDVDPPAHAPPLFMAVAQDHFMVTSGLIALFQEWKGAGKPAELHIYDNTNEGEVGFTAQGQPMDLWLDALAAWMNHHGFKLGAAG